MDLILALCVVGVLVVIVIVASFVSVRNSLQRTPRLDQPSGIPSDPYRDLPTPTQPFNGSIYSNPQSLPGAAGGQILLHPPHPGGQSLPSDATVVGSPPPPPPGTTGMFIREVRRTQRPGLPPTIPVPVNIPGVPGLTIQAIRRRGVDVSPSMETTSPMAGGIRVNPIRRSTASLDIPADMGIRIPCPPSVAIFYNQKDCRICGDTIRFSFSHTGWARCLKTNRLIHGHCYGAYKASETWCGICDAACRSGQAMSIEGVSV